MEFEWDLPKAELNLRKHGVSFEEAKKVFTDPLNIEWADDCDHEERTNIVGQFQNQFYYVVYTERYPKIRLISARRATKNEQARYYYENFP
jgi:uncharacterized protein